MRTRHILWGASWWVGRALDAETHERVIVKPDVFNAALENLRKAEQTRAAERALAGA